MLGLSVSYFPKYVMYVVKLSSHLLKTKNYLPKLHDLSLDSRSIDIKMFVCIMNVTSHQILPNALSHHRNRNASWRCPLAPTWLILWAIICDCLDIIYCSLAFIWWTKTSTIKIQIIFRTFFGFGICDNHFDNRSKKQNI